METIADYFSLKQRIKELERRLDVYRAKKVRAVTALKKVKSSRPVAVEVLLKLCDSGKIDLKTKDIADACCITQASVRRTKSRLKREGKINC